MSDFEYLPPEQNLPTAPMSNKGLVATEQSRAIAEAQAAVVMAKMNPRDEQNAYVRIMKSCERLSLASQAEYSYKRGGQLVTGPSIRLAETLAQHWGNLQYGFREVSRSGDESEVETFCWDLETNVKCIRSMSVRHIRDKKEGNVKLTAERDIYELVANQAQRRVRACILEVIPGDIIDAARAKCEATIKAGDKTKPFADRVRDMFLAFANIGVTKELIETFVGHKSESLSAQEFASLTKIFTSIRDGVATREEFFIFGPAPETASSKLRKARAAESEPAPGPPAEKIDPKAGWFYCEAAKRELSPDAVDAELCGKCPLENAAEACEHFQ